MAAKHVLRPGYEFVDEFQFGLDLSLGAVGLSPIQRA
jgi:hypothetical protein